MSQDDYENELSHSSEGEDRVAFYQQVSHDDDMSPDEDFVLRFRRGVIDTQPASLPSLKTNAKADVCGGETQDPVAEEEPKLVLPQGGWKVQKVPVVEQDGFPSLADARKLQSPPQRQSFSPTWKKNWKKIPDFLTNYGKRILPSIPPPSTPDPDPVPVPVSVPLPEPLPQIIEEPVEAEDEFRPAPTRSRERKPRLLTPSNPPVGRQPATPSVAQPDRSQSFKNTKMCKNKGDCRRRPNCTFAHSLEEFNPIECRFQGRCKTPNTCTFKHHFETKEVYLQRLNNLM